MMWAMRRAWLGLVFLSLACGGKFAEIGDESDAGDGNGDATLDATTPYDGPTGPPIDGGIFKDASSVLDGRPPPLDGATLVDGACAPAWCGCGECNPADIVCTQTPRPCPLGCVGGCPELSQAYCKQVNQNCIRFGVDAAQIGCYGDLDCPPWMCCPIVNALTGHCVDRPSTLCQ
jgi:hypothetical protein